MRPCHKQAGTCAIIATFILFFCTLSFAQTEGIKGVQFKDGSIIYGRVIKMNVNDIQIETNDGKIISSKFDEVDNFIKMDDIRGVRFKDGSVIYGSIVEMNVKMLIILTNDSNIITRKFDDVASFIKEGDEESLKSLSNARHTWEIGPEISYIQYEEPDVMKEKGMMYGIVGSYAYHNYIMLKLEGKFAYGQLDYDGATWAGDPLTIKGISNYMLEFRGLLGYDFAVKAITITPYLGIGYRWLNDNAQEKYFGGYKRESNYIYLPVGLEFVANLGNGWSLGATGEYDFFLRGRQISCLSDSDPGFNDPENKQTKGYGVRGSISIAKKGERVGFIIEPYVKYWNIDDSDIQLITYYGAPYRYGLEPKNNSTEIGCKLAIMF